MEINVGRMAAWAEDVREGLLMTFPPEEQALLAAELRQLGIAGWSQWLRANGSEVNALLEQPPGRRKAHPLAAAGRLQRYTALMQAQRAATFLRVLMESAICSGLLTPQDALVAAANAASDLADVDPDAWPFPGPHPLLSP